MANTLHDLLDEQHIYLVVEASAANTDKEYGIKTPFKCKLIRVDATPSEAVTGADTDYFSIIVYNRGTDGNGSTALGTIDFTSGTDNDIYQKAAVYAPASELALAADVFLSFKVDNTGSTGLASPSWVVDFVFRGN